MARITDIVTVPKFEGSKNRDLGKKFFITEWPAEKADSWVTRVGFAFNQGAGAIPLDLREIGWEGIAILGINTFLRGSVRSEEMIPLFDELFQCVQIIRDHAHLDVATPIVSSDDIEEVATRWWLRAEVVRVHVGFSVTDALSALFRSIMSKAPTIS